jgi:hypothetical protein
MKVVLYYYQTKSEFERIMKIVLPCGIIISEYDNDIDFIYIVYNKILYKFNRYNINFITKVEKAINENPYGRGGIGNSYEGHLHVLEIDDRFTNKKYYTIERQMYKTNINSTKESLEIHKDAIIDDLYYSRFEF